MRRGAIAALLAGVVACGGEPKDRAPSSNEPEEHTGTPTEGSVPLPNLARVDPDIVRAVEEARAGVLAAPEASEAWAGYGDRLSVHQFLTEAAAAYARAEELDPTERLWPYRLGWALFNADPEGARAAFERALPRLDDYAPMHESYAQVCFRLGDAETARTHFERAAALDARDPWAPTGLGQIALATGDFEGARAHFEQALERSPDHTEAHIGLAQALHALGRPEEARRHADRSRALPQVSMRRDVLGQPILPPAGARARAENGRALERAKKFEEALAEYRIAVASDPHYYVARRRLAMLLRRRDRVAEAEALLLEALELDPGPEAVAAIEADLDKVRGGR